MSVPKALFTSQVNGVRVFVSTLDPAPDKVDGCDAVYVDWCDAYAYCKWAGKRLCGKLKVHASFGYNLWQLGTACALQSD